MTAKEIAYYVQDMASNENTRNHISIIFDNDYNGNVNNNDFNKSNGITTHFQVDGSSTTYLVSIDFSCQRTLKVSLMPKSITGHRKVSTPHCSASLPSTQLRNFYDSCLRKSLILRSEREANNFFRAIFAFDNKLDLVYNLSDNSLHGKEVLQTALSLCCSNPSNINSTVIKFLDYIGDNILNIGSTKKCVSDLYLITYNTPKLLSIIEDLIPKGTLNDPLVISWFLVSICRSEANCRENPLVLRISKLLKAAGTSVPQLDTLLCSQNIDEGKLGEVSLEYLRSMQPQHDNDFSDYRKVSIVPTATEINSRVSVCGIAPTWRNFADSEQENEASLLDRQFRLLREDMVAPMREEIQKELRVIKNDRKRMYDKPCAISVMTNPNPCVLIRISMPFGIQKRIQKMRKYEKFNFFENAGHRILSRDSLVAFITNNEVVNVGVIVRRSIKDEFISENGYFCIGVSFFGDSLMKTLGVMGGQESYSGRYYYHPMADFLFQATTSYFSYEPVLRCLQDMTEIPFAEEIVRGQNPLPIQTTGRGEEDNIPRPMMFRSFGFQRFSLTRSPLGTAGKIPVMENFHLPDNIRLLLTNDPSQLRAVEMSLTQRVSLIQGPPGTGKTFVGVQIARSLIANNCHRILCLCYTNHALDSFLEELIAVGVPKGRIVRVGKSPKISEELQDCCLNEKNETRFDMSQSRRYAMLKGEQEELSKHMQLLEYKVNHSSNWKWNSFYFLSKYLKQERSSELSKTLNALSCLSDVSTGGFSAVGSDGKAMKPDYFFKRWYNGKSRHETENLTDKRSNHSIWKLSTPERLALLKKWSDDNKQPLLEEMARTMRQYESVRRTLDELRNETKLSVLKDAYVIGCTTTSAAKNKSLLADVRLNVIMIEEAAEILEAHVLTTLTPSVKALIMIGDHKQLRPKLEHFDLRKDSGKGVDFDVSLFERLANQEGNFPVSRLNIQHRMRPEISSIVRNTTYSDLEDHVSVFNRDHIKGLESDFLWIDHAYEERNDEEKVELGSSSKVNLYEVGMVVEIVRYLLLQGYQPSDLVVLTPYLGQLVQIRSALEKASLAVDLGDLDEEDVTRLADNNDGDAVMNSSDNEDSAFKAKKPSVRVATIDNYQGEESKIVIASLVRSNVDRDVGFLSGPERVNVLFSRARDGMIIVGNVTTFNEARTARAKRLWSGIITQLTESNRIYDGLPTKCVCHGNTPSSPINTVEAFQLHVPDGGCNEKCTVILPHCPHYHLCPKKCHHNALDPNGHDNIKCIEILIEKCTNGHDVQRICGEKAHKPCQDLVMEQCPNGHHYNRLCCLSVAKPCKICQRLEAEAVAARRNEAELLKRREEELAQAETQRIQAESILESEKIKSAISNFICRARLEKALELEHDSQLNVEEGKAALTTSGNNSNSIHNVFLNAANNSILLEKRIRKAGRDNVNDDENVTLNL
eukprot:gene135-218_t